MSPDTTASATWWVCVTAPAQEAALQDLPVFRSDTPQALLGAWNGRSDPARVVLLAPEANGHDATALQQEDAWRQALQSAGIPYQTLWPDQGSHGLALRRLMGLAPTPARRLYNPWPCDGCSDPACEHRLFQDLLAQRPPVPGS